MRKVGCPKGHKQSPEHIAKRVAKTRGKKRSPESIARYKISNKYINLGRKRPLWVREKISAGQRGDKNHNWQGGITAINLKQRNSLKYRLWREIVLRRDNHTCVWCGSSDKVHADHIKPFAYFPELRYEITNGRTLCVPCHKTTDSYFYKGSKRKREDFQ